MKSVEMVSPSQYWLMILLLSHVPQHSLFERIYLYLNAGTAIGKRSTLLCIFRMLAQLLLYLLLLLYGVMCMLVQIFWFGEELRYELFRYIPSEVIMCVCGIGLESITQH